MSQSIFLLQTMTLTQTLGGSAYLEGDWIFSSDLAQHQLSKHPENNRPNCESFILGEERRANGMAQSGEVCHLYHLPSLTALVAKPRGQSVLLEITLEWWCIWTLQHFAFLHSSLYLPFLVPLQFALPFLLLFPQQLWPAWRKSVVAFL